MSCKYKYNGVEYTLKEIRENINNILLENNINLTDLLKSENFVGKEGEANFNRWKGKNKLVSSSEIQEVRTGQPIIAKVYHGTTNEFYEFDASVKGNIEGHLGKVNYFTSDYQDANQNYLSEGADITGRIDIRQDELEDTLRYDYQSSEEGLDFQQIIDDFNITEEEVNTLYPSGQPEFIQAEEISRFLAEKELKGTEEKVLELYVKLNNPVVLGNGATWFDALEIDEVYLEEVTQEIAEEYDITEEEAKNDYELEIRDRAVEKQGDSNKIVEALEEALDDNGYDSSLASDILGDNYYESEVDLDKLEQDLRKAELYDNYDGESASSQVIADFFKKLGFDGIILTDVAQRFRNMGLSDSTSHIHVFDEFNNQIKLADGSNVTFGETSDIRFSKSPQLKIEVKEVNGRLVVEPLVNGTKAGALRMLPYEDGYRVDSVTVYDKYQNKRLGTRLYQEAIKFLLKSQTPLYSLKVRSENAKRIWDKFVAIGVAQKVGEDYIAPNKGGLDKNNEAKPSDVMQYANTTDEKLSKEETVEAIDLAVSLGVESSQEAVAILKDAFLENDAFVFDKKKMKKAGFNDYEITKILVDVNLQNQIKNNLAKLENTDFSAPLMDVERLPEIGIFGKQKVRPKVKTVNVKTVNEQGEVVDKVSDTKELLRKTYPDTLPNDMPQIASSLLKSSENVVNTHNELFYNTLKDLKDAALDLGVDLRDIENRVFPLENFKSFVNSLMNYYTNPSDAFAEVYDEFFENYGVEKATKPTMSTPYTEYELFDKFNLVRKGDEYIKVEDVEIETSTERQAKIPQLEVEDFAVDFDKLEKLVYHKEQLGAEMKTLQKPLVEEINLREVKKNPYLKATSEGVKLVSEDPLTAQKAELYGYEPKVVEKQPKKIETDYSLVQDVLVTQLTSENKVRTPKGNFTKFMDDNNKSVFLLDGSKQSAVDLEGYLSKADNTPKIEAKKLYSKEEFENNFGCLN